MEIELLRLLDFEVGLTASKYVKYFFAIRDHSELDTGQFPIKPLDKKALQRLEVLLLLPPQQSLHALLCDNNSTKRLLINQSQESSKATERKARKARLGLSVSTSELSTTPSSPFVVLS
jgi:hypothetical protein